MPLEYPVDNKFLEQMNSELAGWDNPAARLKEALNKDEFALYCQPILALGDAEHYPLAEVLVRLREEEKAMLPPGEFLPVFEHYKMMPQLDRWVVRQVVRHIAKGSQIPSFSMNVSGQTLEDGEFPEFFAVAAGAAGVSPASVLFEIDEPDLLGRPQAVARFAAAIKAAGGGLLLDGFGRKAVSFTPFKALQLYFVKVDGSVVRKVVTSEVARTKLNAVLRVAEVLKIGVIAECVEDEDVLARLKVLGVGYVQGFGIVQPQAIE